MRRSIRARLSLATAALVAGVVALVLGGAYLAAVAGLEREAHTSVTRELSSLLDSWRSGGIDALVAEVQRRSHDPGEVQFAYLVAREQHAKIAGNVRDWPQGVPSEGRAGPVPLEVRQADVWMVRHFRLESVNLSGGGHLLVGRDVSDQSRWIQRLQYAAIGGLALASLGAVAAGLAVGRRLLGRVETMRATIGAILQGQKDGRVPVSERDDEFDELAARFNTLLDANERLVQQVREATNNIAHDLRTPLQRMHGRLEEALASPGTPAQARELLKSLSTDSDRLLETFNGLLQIARLESPELRRSMQPVDIASLVEDLADLYSPLAEEAGLGLERRVEPGLRLTADRELLGQALANLIDNAIKYAPGGGALEVEARRLAGGAEIVVADRGPGIAPEDRPRALERLGRLDASRSVPGTGLGLSFVAAVAHLHGGELELADNRPGLRAILHLRG